MKTPSDPLEQLRQVSKGVTEFHASFVERIAGARDEGMRQYMAAIASKMKELQAEVEKTFPKAWAVIQSQAAATQQQNSAIMQQIEALKAKQAETQAKMAAAAKARAEAAAPAVAQFRAHATELAAKPKEPPLPAVSSQLSDTLRDELLQRFGLKEAPRHKPAEFQEAGEDWRRPELAGKSIAPT